MSTSSSAMKIDEINIEVVTAPEPNTSNLVGLSPHSPEKQKKVDDSYAAGDVEALKEAHGGDIVDFESVLLHEEEKPGFGGDNIKAFVFGGLDGIVSTFALVASLGGANVEVKTLLAVGFAKVIADAFSMGFGEYTSARAELENSVRLRRREEWETKHFQDGEVKEMVELYMEKGVAKEDAVAILTRMVRYPAFFVEHMMVVEHGVMAADEDDKWGPARQGLVCFLAFVLFGIVPLLGFIVLYAIQGAEAEGAGSMGQTLLLAYCLTALTLFLMGVTKARLTGNPKFLQSGLIMVGNGTIAGGVAYLVGEILTAAF